MVTGFAGPRDRPEPSRSPCPRAACPCNDREIMLTRSSVPIFADLIIVVRCTDSCLDSADAPQPCGIIFQPMILQGNLEAKRTLSLHEQGLAWVAHTSIIPVAETWHKTWQKKIPS